MSMFDKLRSSLGMKPKAFSSGAGHKLGGADDKDSTRSNSNSNSSSGKATAPSSPRFAGPVEYDVTFTDTTLGLTFLHPVQADGAPDTAALRELDVHVVSPGSESQRLGIRAGDVVLAVAGNPVDSYDTFVMLVKALARPLLIRLRRGMSAGSSSSSSLSAAELAERREMNQRAADARNSAWDKRVHAASSRRKGEEERSGAKGGVHAHAEAARKGDSNPATQQAAALARQQEERQAQQNGGFSAFKPHMSFSSASGGGTGAGTAPVLGQQPNAPAPNVFSSAGNALGGGAEPAGLALTEAAVEDTDLALGLLLSVEAGVCCLCCAVAGSGFAGSSPCLH